MRLQVSVSDDLVKRIDYYASRFGCSRSALCSVLIGQGLMGYDKVDEVFEGIGETVKKDIKTSAKEV